MAFDISKLTRMGEFSMELESLGRVSCLSLTTGHLSQANKKLGSSGVHGHDFLRWLFGEMARRPVEGRSDEDGPIGTNFTTQELSTVTNEELEGFADKLIQKNKYLLKTHKASDIHRLIDESACDFLVRAFRHHAAEQKIQWEKMTQSVSKSVFALATAEAVQQPALDAIAEANRYLTENSASMAIAMHVKHEQDLIRAVTGPFQDGQHYFEQSSVSALLAKVIYSHEDMIRETTRGLAESMSTTMSDVIATGLEKQQQETRDLLKIHEAMFRLPQASEATRLLASYQVGAVASLAQQHAKETIDRLRFLETITAPWVNIAGAERSVTSILELQGMGNALKTIEGFDLELTAALRLDLGDWRDKIAFPGSIFIDPVARTDFYISRGFNTALTDFPDAAFHQSLHVAGLDGELLDFELYGAVVLPSTNPEEEAGLRRTNNCHDLLLRFERQLRQFIDHAMTTQYGTNWPKRQLHQELYERWHLKKQRAESNGGTPTFIEVADFTDYETIICKKDHWRDIFSFRFKKKESVRESLQRLHPIRLATMHARIVTKEDELYLLAEITRLKSAIERPS